MSDGPVVTGFYHEETGSIAYLVEDPATRHAAIIDPVLDYEEKAGRVSTAFTDRMLDEVARRGLTIDWILETHPHADHLSSAGYLKDGLGGPTGIGERVVEVQAFWKGVYGLPDLPADGSQWDRLFADGERFAIGSIEARVMASPGHTVASVSYLVGDAAFIHDTLFQPDYGTARADFPGGNAGDLYRSIQAILALPETTRLFTGHDYRPGGREARWESTVAEQKGRNRHLLDAPDEDAFVALRTGRDRGLGMPKLILPSLQVNIRGGRLPEPDANGRVYLKIPVGAL